MKSQLKKLLTEIAVRGSLPMYSRIDEGESASVSRT
jgi:hypothetical protein